MKSKTISILILLAAISSPAPAAQTASSNLSGRVCNVLNYGMTNSFKRPISTRLQALVNSLTNGGSIMFPIGDWYLDQCIVITNNNISFVGEDRWLSRLISWTNANRGIYSHNCNMFLYEGFYTDIPGSMCQGCPGGDNRPLAQTPIFPTASGSLCITSSIPGAFAGWRVGNWIRVCEGTRQPKNYLTNTTHGLEDAVLYHRILGLTNYVTNDVIILDRPTECDLLGRYFGPGYYKTNIGGVYMYLTNPAFWPTQMVARITPVENIHFKNLTMIGCGTNNYGVTSGVGAGPLAANCSVEDCVFDCLTPVGDPKLINGFYMLECFNCRVARCSWKAGGLGGFVMSQWGTLEDCDMLQFGRASSEYDEGDNHCKLVNCEWANNDGSCFGVLDFGALSHYMTMENCKFSNMRRGAIVFGGEHNSVSHCIFDGVDVIGFGGGVYGRSDFAFKGNDLHFTGNIVRQNPSSSSPVFGFEPAYIEGGQTLIGNTFISSHPPACNANGVAQSAGFTDLSYITASGNRFVDPNGNAWRNYLQTRQGAFNVTPFDDWSWITASVHVSGGVWTRSFDLGDFVTIYNWGHDPAADATNQFGLFVTQPGTLGALGACFGYIDNVNASLLVVTNGRPPLKGQYVNLWGATNAPIKVVDYWRGWTNILILDYTNATGQITNGRVAFSPPVFRTVPFANK